MKKVLSRLKHTAKLESLIALNADYETIVRQSQKIDQYIVEEMKRINERQATNSLQSDKTKIILH